MSGERKLVSELVAKWLKETREQAGVSQQALADQIGKGQSDIAKIEAATKNLSVTELLEIAKALSVTDEQLSQMIAWLYNELRPYKSLWNE